MMKKHLKLTIFNCILVLLMTTQVAFGEEVIVEPKTSHNGGNVLTIAEHQRLEASIAANMMNRLAVVNDRILNVFGDDGTFTVQTDEHTGQLFIKPTPENGNKPIAITLITENGITQDLTLNPTRTKATTVILRSAINNKPYASTVDPVLPGFPRNQTMLDHWIQTMKQAVLGELPVVTIRNTATRKADKLQLKFVKCYQAGSLLVQVWLVKNTSKVDRELQERDLFKNDDLALSFGHRMLLPNTTTLMYVLKTV